VLYTTAKSEKKICENYLLTCGSANRDISNDILGCTVSKKLQVKHILHRELLFTSFHFPLIPGILQRRNMIMEYQN